MPVSTLSVCGLFGEIVVYLSGDPSVWVVELEVREWVNSKLMLFHEWLESWQVVLRDENRVRQNWYNRVSFIGRGRLLISQIVSDHVRTLRHALWPVSRVQSDCVVEYAVVFSVGMVIDISSTILSRVFRLLGYGGIRWRSRASSNWRRMS